MANQKQPRKKPIEQYDHRGKQRVNNPPVGLVTPHTVPQASPPPSSHEGIQEDVFS